MAIESLISFSMNLSYSSAVISPFVNLLREIRMSLVCGNEPMVVVGNNGRFKCVFCCSSPVKAATSTSHYPPTQPPPSDFRHLILCVLTGLCCRLLVSLLCFITFAFAFSLHFASSFLLCIYACCCYHPTDSTLPEKPHAPSPSRLIARYPTRLCVLHVCISMRSLARFSASLSVWIS